MELHERLSGTNGDGPASVDPFAEVKNRIHLAIVSELGPRLFDVAGGSARERVIDEIRAQLQQEAGLSREDREQITAEIADDIFGYGPLERLLPDQTISEIMVNGPHEIWIERRGLLSRTPLRFADESHLRRIITKMVGQIGRRIDESSPMVEARLPDGSRVHAIVPPLSLTRPAADDPQVRPGPLRARRAGRDRDAVEPVRRLPRPLRPGRPEHADLGRNRHGEDDAPERAVGSGARRSTGSSRSRTPPSCSSRRRTC